MPERENLNNMQLQRALQELLEKHSNEDVVKALSGLAGALLPEKVETQIVWTYEAVIHSFKTNEEYMNYAETSQKTYGFELASLTKHLQAEGIDDATVPISDLVLTDKITHLSTFISKVKSESSKNKRKSLLRKLFRFGLRLSGFNPVEVERILNSKVFEIKKVSNQEIRYLEPHQVTELLSLSIFSAYGFRNFVMLAVYLTTGLRNSELTHLTVDQVYETEQLLKVHRKRHKGQLKSAFISDEGMGLLLPFIKMQYRQYGSTLSEIKDNLGDGNHFVFFTKSSQTPITERTVQHVVKTLAQQCKSIPDDRKGKITPHNLRHTFAVKCVKNGVNFNSLMRFMDHSSLEMVNRYLRLSNKDYQEDLNKGSIIDDLLGGEDIDK
ncbi:tyrosine-type recombinase/integrase [Paenibacillus sp. NRS-1760]|uniref:tyrosine-type recombinase/integrase n=1 Tax=Paenibacillus sp. NRS-1760 TaxID=3233902 RepID=UPI003D29CF4E